MRLLRGEPGSVFVRCCGFPVLRRTRGGGGPTHAETKSQEKKHSATQDRRWAFGIVVVGVAENIRFL